MWQKLVALMLALALAMGGVLGAVAEGVETSDMVPQPTETVVPTPTMAEVKQSQRDLVQPLQMDVPVATAAEPVYYNSLTDLRDSHPDVPENAWKSSCYICSIAMILTTLGRENATPYDILVFNSQYSSKTWDPFIGSWPKVAEAYQVNIVRTDFTGNAAEKENTIRQACQTNPQGIMLFGKRTKDDLDHAVVAYLDSAGVLRIHNPGFSGWNAHIVGQNDENFTSYDQFTWYRTFTDTSGPSATPTPTPTTYPVPDPPADAIAKGTFGAGLVWWIDSNNTLSIAGNGSMPDWRLPQEAPWQSEWNIYSKIKKVEIYPGIESIGGLSFSSLLNIESVKIPNTVTAIRSNAFGDNRLQRVEIPASVINIEENAFKGCELLTDFIVDAQNTAYTSKDGILYNKNGTKLLACPAGKQGRCIISEGTVEIAPNAFYESNAEDIVFPNSLKKIGDCAFMHAGIHEVNIPEGVTSIGREAFYLAAMQTVTIPSTVTSIGTEAFNGYRNFTSIEVDKNNPNFSSVDGVLLNKEQTVILKFPEGKSGIYYIPETVVLLKQGTFGTCPNLVGIVIPESVRKLDILVIGGPCENLKGVFFSGDVPQIHDYCFTNRTFTGYYPMNNDSWTEETLQDYGGHITWMTWTPGDMVPLPTPTPQPGHVYDITQGNGQNIQVDYAQDAVFRANIDFTQFTGVAVDAVVVADKNYDAWAGSTYIRLHADYLKTLSVGEHTLTVLATDGQAETTFTITGEAEAPAATPVPQPSAQPTPPASVSDPQHPGPQPPESGAAFRNSRIPKTADETPVSQGIVLFVASLLGLVAINWKRKRQHR